MLGKFALDAPLVYHTMNFFIANLRGPFCRTNVFVFVYIWLFTVKSCTCFWSTVALLLRLFQFKLFDWFCDGSKGRTVATTSWEIKQGGCNTQCNRVSTQRLFATCHFSPFCRILHISNCRAYHLTIFFASFEISQSILITGDARVVDSLEAV